MSNRFIFFTGIVFLFFVILASFLGQHATVQAATTHVVISEIQLAGGVANDEFIELYNPTNVSISLSNWRLTKKTALGTESNLISTMSGSIISHGYFLIARPEYDGLITPDATYSGNTISADNTVLLYDNLSNVVDKVGFNTATDKETTSLPNPAANHSVERKANSVSTVASMTTGTDQFAGNGEDTDNNSADFITRTTADPQNSTASIEPPLPTPTPSIMPTVSLTPTESPTPLPTISLTPTMTVILTPTVSLTSSPTLTPTLTPTDSPIPTLTLTPSPTITPTPTITMTPTNSPTPTMTSVPAPTPSTSSGPTATPTITVTPTITPTVGTTVTPTPTESVHHHPLPRLVCSWTTQEIRFFGMVIRIPFFHCVWQ